VASAVKPNLDRAYTLSQEFRDLWGGEGMSFVQQNDGAVAVRQKI
jgi:hypothetical protein